MDQFQAPLWEAIIKYASKKVIPFHTPGHKLRSGVFSDIKEITGSFIWAMDASDEVEDLKFNNSFEDLLQLAEDLASDLYGSRATKFLVNGTSGGIHTMLFGLTGDVLIPRFSHQSVYAGLILSEANPIYIPTKFDRNWHIPLPPRSSDLEQYFSNPITGLLLTHPTYYGTVADINAISSLTKAHNSLLLVDEAHGSHFHFSSDFPSAAVAANADIVVQSTHKTLGSLTQSSMLHINNPNWIDKINRISNILQTTSPSLIMLGILDAVRKEMALNGKELAANALEFSLILRNRLQVIPGVKVASLSDVSHDPTKIVFSLGDLGLTGLEVESILRKNYNIQVELSDYYNVLALVTIGDSIESISALADAVGDLAVNFARSKSLAQLDLSLYETLPDQVLDLRTAFASNSETCSLLEAKGRISSGFLTPYPPGVPLVIPGEIISQQLVEYLIACMDQGWQVRGIDRGKVSVIKE